MYGSCGSKDRPVFTIEPSEDEKTKNAEKTPFLLRRSFLPSAMSTVSLTMRKDQAYINTIKLKYIVCFIYNFTSNVLSYRN